ncbi:MAG TPA: GTP 3',8-cyclase MoaA [Methanocorpusculum sp.]|nr:GTP 3',8-cyclase MoaA [Methanocorpusculum sp.]HJJ91513.1 GTP 3',8-cyclase MoaA [Methanocorpusculum sp.]HJJ94727.1 GTP 3',8-cyclase MoaA [Methanocorpusculum sp.]
MTDADSLMTDSYGRRITDVRIALNSACNLRCIYCHHEGETVNGCIRDNSKEALTKEELIEILTVFRNMGVKTVKLTGGEPTLRPDLTDIIRAVPEGMEISLTTNGTRLKDIASDLKAAGLSRVNISLDTLNRERYTKITGRNLLPDVLEGLKAALEAGLTPVKLNVVLLPGLNDDEIDDFLAFAREHEDIILQFIELMDMNGWTDNMTEGKSNAQFAAELEERFKKEADMIETRRMHHRRKYKVHGTSAEIVRPMHNLEFCANCNRLRITSDGKLKPCLLKTGNEVNIKGVHGDELVSAIAKAVSARSPYFKEEA